MFDPNVVFIVDESKISLGIVILLLIKLQRNVNELIVVPIGKVFDKVDMAEALVADVGYVPAVNPTIVLIPPDVGKVICGTWLADVGRPPLVEYVPVNANEYPAVTYVAAVGTGLETNWTE